MSEECVMKKLLSFRLNCCLLETNIKLKKSSRYDEKMTHDKFENFN